MQKIALAAERRVAIEKVSAEFPEMAKNLKTSRRALESVNFNSLGDGYARALTSRRILKVKDPAIRSVLRKIFVKKLEAKEWADYAKQLNLDALTHMKVSRRSASAASLRAGKVERWAVLKVLVKRAKSRGETMQKAVHSFGDDDAQFLNALERGPFLDKAQEAGQVIDGETILHGMDTHFIDRDFNSGLIEAEKPGRSAEFYSYSGGNKRKAKSVGGGFRFERR